MLTQNSAAAGGSGEIGNPACVGQRAGTDGASVSRGLSPSADEDVGAALASAGSGPTGAGAGSSEPAGEGATEPDEVSGLIEKVPDLRDTNFFTTLTLVQLFRFLSPPFPVLLLLTTMPANLPEAAKV